MFNPARLTALLVAVSFAAGLNLYITVAALGLLSVLVWGATQLGYIKPLVVISGSMEPGIMTGDLLVDVQRPTAFLVHPDMPGFRVVGTVRKLGIRGSTQAELEFTRMRVPDANVLGTVGKGFNVAVQVLNGGRLALAAGCTESAKAIVGEMARYAEQRVQFGAPLASFEITQRKLSTLAAEVRASYSVER